MAFQITRKLRWTAITLASLLFLYAAIGFWLVPRVVRSQILEFSAQHWRREPTLGAVTFDPFTFTLEARGFAFQDSRGQPLLAFDRLLVDLDVSSLWRRGASFHAIELDRPSARVQVRADGSLNLTELTAPFAQPAGTGPADEEPLRLFIDRFQLREGIFDFEDQARATPFKARLTPVSFELLDFGTTGESGNQYALQAMSPAGEKFRWSGAFGLSPLSSHGQFELSDVQARTLWSYLQESLGFEVAGGLVGINGGYAFAATEPEITLQLTLARVGVTDLKLRARGGDTDWVALSRITLADSKIDLARRVVDVASLKLGAGDVIATRAADGSVNLLSLLDAPGARAPQLPAAATAPPPPSPAWTVNLPDVAIEGLRVSASDEFVKPAAAFSLAPINLHLRGFSTAPGRELDLDGDLTLAGGGKVSLRGRGVPSDRTFSGKVRVDDLNLASMQPYIGTYTQMTLLSGVLGTELEAEVESGAWRIAGDLDCTKLHTVDNALREDFIKWDRLALRGIEYRSSPAALRIATIDARAPYLRMIIAPDQTTNIGKVLARPASAPGPVQTVRGVTAPTGAPGMSISIGKVRMENGSANFADFWIKPNYAVSLQQLGGTLSGLSSRKDSRARLDLKGKIDRYAPVEIGGELNLLSASLFTDIRVKFDGVELTSVTPYSGRFAGYPIEKGKLSVNVRYKVENRKLDADQRFVIDQLTLGERVDSPDAVKLPLRLAVALLKDRNGVIDLGLPVTGSLDDPQFRLGPIIWKAFVNLLASVATSPFKLLGGMFGGGEEVNLIDFDPGSAALDAPGKEKIAALTKALRERPQLSLEVPALYAPDADYADLAAKDVAARLAALARARKQSADTASEPLRRFDLLLALYKSDKPGAALPPDALALQETPARERDRAALEKANPELEAALRPSIDSLESALQSLARQRARAIQDALLSSGEVEPGRVFLLSPAASPATNNKIRLALSLK